MLMDTFLQPQEHLPVMPFSPPSTQEVVLRYLEDPSGSREVQRLRQEIDLTVHARLNPYFHAEEKKRSNRHFRCL